MPFRQRRQELNSGSSLGRSGALRAPPSKKTGQLWNFLWLSLNCPQRVLGCFECGRPCLSENCRVNLSKDRIPIWKRTAQGSSQPFLALVQQVVLTSGQFKEDKKTGLLEVHRRRFRRLGLPPQSPKSQGERLVTLLAKIRTVAGVLEDGRSETPVSPASIRRGVRLPRLPLRSLLSQRLVAVKLEIWEPSSFIGSWSVLTADHLLRPTPSVTQTDRVVPVSCPFVRLSLPLKPESPSQVYRVFGFC